jgi:hypothetical protein
MTQNDKFKYPSIIHKMIENNITSFSEDELNRVFEGVASRAACKRGVNTMVNAGLTMNDIQELSQQQMRLF